MKLPPLTKTEKAVMGGAFALGVVAVLAFKKKIAAGPTSSASASRPAPPAAGRSPVPASQSHGSAVPRTSPAAVAASSGDDGDTSAGGGGVPTYDPSRVYAVGEGDTGRSGGDQFTADVGD